MPTPIIRSLYRRLMGIGIAPAIVLGSTAALAGNPAGVIPVTCLNDEVYLLLAYDTNPLRRSWATFGGHADYGETLPQTAAREFHEETGCVFTRPTPEDLHQNEAVKIQRFVSYVYPVPYVDPELITASRCGTPGERRDWVWLLLDDVVASFPANRPVIKDSKTENSYPLWRKSRDVLAAAHEAGLLSNEAIQCE